MPRAPKSDDLSTRVEELLQYHEKQSGIATPGLAHEPAVRSAISVSLSGDLLEFVRNRAIARGLNRSRVIDAIIREAYVREQGKKMRKGEGDGDGGGVDGGGSGSGEDSKGIGTRRKKAAAK